MVEAAYVNSIQHWLCKWRQALLLRREGSKEERHSRVLAPRCWDERLWHSTQCSATTENVDRLEKLEVADRLSVYFENSMYSTASIRILNQKCEWIMYFTESSSSAIWSKNTTKIFKKCNHYVFLILLRLCTVQLLGFNNTYVPSNSGCVERNEHVQRQKNIACLFRSDSLISKVKCTMSH